MNIKQRELISEAWEEALERSTVGDVATISLVFQDLVQKLRETDKKLDDLISQNEHQ